MEKKDGIDHNSNSISNQSNLNGKADENIIYRSGKDNLAFRME